MVRMTNTFLLAGDEDPDEIVAQTPKGIYVAQLGGGQVNTATGDFVFGMTEAYLIEERPHHRAAQERQPHRQRPGRALQDRRHRQRLRHVARHLRQGRPERRRRLRAADDARHGRHDRRHGKCLSSSAWPTASSNTARADEEVEVYVAHGRETSIRVFEGEIEELTAAESAGVGVRVISGGKQGFSYVGSARRVGARPRRSPRPVTTPALPPSTSTSGLASPDGVEAPVLDLWREELVSFPTDEKLALALELERRVRAGDSRIRQVVSSDYVDGFGETAIATSRGIEVDEPADRLLPLRPRCGRRG